MMDFLHSLKGKYINYFFYFLSVYISSTYLRCSLTRSYFALKFVFPVYIIHRGREDNMYLEHDFSYSFLYKVQQLS